MLYRVMREAFQAEEDRGPCAKNCNGRKTWGQQRNYDRKKLRDWHINEIWSRGVDFSYIPWNVPARILLKLKIHQNWDLSSCQMSEHVVTFLFYLFIYLFFTFTWLFSRYTVV